MRFVKALILALISSFSFAGTVQILNTQTGRPDYIALPTTSGWPANASGCLANDGSGNMSYAACSGAAGGASALETMVNGVRITSPTASQNFIGSGVTGAATGSTATVTINAIWNQNTLQSGSTFYVSSGTVGGQLITSQLKVTGSGAGNPTTIQNTGTPYLVIDQNTANSPAGEIDFTTLLSTTIYMQNRASSFAFGVSTTTTATQPSDRIVIYQGTNGSTKNQIQLNPNNSGLTIDPSTTTLGSNLIVVGSMTVQGANGLTVSNLTSGQCVQTGSGGLLTVTGSACGSGSVTLVSSGVAFGSATNTITQSTSAFAFNASTNSLLINAGQGITTPNPVNGIYGNLQVGSTSQDGVMNVFMPGVTSAISIQRYLNQPTIWWRRSDDAANEVGQFNATNYQWLMDGTSYGNWSSAGLSIGFNDGAGGPPGHVSTVTVSGTIQLMDHTDINNKPWGRMWLGLGGLINPTLTSIEFGPGGTSNRDTSFYRNASGTLGMYAGGVTALTISSTAVTAPGNVNVTYGVTSSTLSVSTLATFTGQVQSSSDVYLSTGSHIYTDEYQNGSYVAISTIDWNQSNNQVVTLTANTTFNFTAPAAPGSTAAHLNLLIKTGAGSFTASWPAAVKWPSGTAPTITATASRADLCTFYYERSTGDYFAQCAQAFTP